MVSSERRCHSSYLFSISYEMACAFFVGKELDYCYIFTLWICVQLLEVVSWLLLLLVLWDLFM